MTKQKNQSDTPEKIIGRLVENEFPVIYKLANESPSDELKQRFNNLMVVSWKYDGSESNGMPVEIVNKEMMELEDAIEANLVDSRYCKHAYSRTGNSLKELSYYIDDSDEFMMAFNNILQEHPRYPIEIKYYLDPEWEGFETLRRMLR